MAFLEVWKIYTYNKKIIHYKNNFTFSFNHKILYMLNFLTFKNYILKV